MFDDKEPTTEMQTRVLIAFALSAMVLLFVPVVAWAIYGTGVTAGSYWEAIRHPLISGVVAGAVGWFVQMLCRNVLTPIPLLTLEVGVSLPIYAGVLLFVMGQKDFYFDLVKQIIQRRQAPAEA